MPSDAEERRGLACHLSSRRRTSTLCCAGSCHRLVPSLIWPSLLCHCVRSSPSTRSSPGVTGTSTQHVGVHQGLLPVVPNDSTSLESLITTSPRMIIVKGELSMEFDILVGLVGGSDPRLRIVLALGKTAGTGLNLAVGIPSRLLRFCLHRPDFRGKGYLSLF